MPAVQRFLTLIPVIATLGSVPAAAQMAPAPGADPPPVVTAPPPVVTAPAPAPARSSQFSGQEIVDAGHRFFGTVSRGLAAVVEKATSQWGQPNGYILGEEASGAFIGGLRYGEGTLYTKNAGDLRVFWQGPTVGFDW